MPLPSMPGRGIASGEDLPSTAEWAVHRSGDALVSGMGTLDHRWMTAFDLPGTLRRIRRLADLSQRELAAELHASKSSIAAAESGASGLDARTLARAAGLAGLRLALLDGDGCEISAMAAGTVRDLGGRRFPAHLDTRHSDERWWRYEHRFDRPRPWFTVDRDRAGRDALRRTHGTPEDHHPFRPGDSPQERTVARRRAALRSDREDYQRRLASGALRPLEVFTCTCPPLCDELDDRSGRPVHAENCPCSCDLC
jgi:transcriptional regulator with XRE-family HTH domain